MALRPTRARPQPPAALPDWAALVHRYALFLTGDPASAAETAARVICDRLGRGDQPDAPTETRRALLAQDPGTPAAEGPLETAITRLAAPARRALFLRLLAGKSTQEAAVLLGCTPAQLRQLQLEGLRALAEADPPAAGPPPDASAP
jgi:hypothetical protein